MADNLSLWSAVEKTPVEQTKPITGKQYKGNSPKPHYLIWRATQTFGPCGIGWGFVIVDEKLLDGAMLDAGFYEKIHMARVRVWYKWEGERGEVEHVGQTVFSGRRRSGDAFTDEDAPKKSVTDALIKALSMIGFAGDIFLGRYDDSKYVDDLRDEAREKRTAAAKPKQTRQAAAPSTASTPFDDGPPPYINDAPPIGEPAAAAPAPPPTDVYATAKRKLTAASTMDIVKKLLDRVKEANEKGFVTAEQYHELWTIGTERYTELDRHEPNILDAG